MIARLKFKLLILLLKWFAKKEMDQWERWEIVCDDGSVFVTIGLQGDGYNYGKIKTDKCF